MRGRGRQAVAPSWMTAEADGPGGLAAAQPSSSSSAGGEAAPPPLPPLHSIHRATVSSLTAFGRFVDISGFPKMGLMHASQTEGEPAQGEAVYVKVVSVDVAKGRYGVSNRFIDQTTGADLDVDGQKRIVASRPTSLLPSLFAVGQGVVQGVKDFGAFVEVQLGGKSHRGMVHISHLAAFHVDRVEDVVREGDRVWVKVVGSEWDDSGRAKISLSMKTVDQETGRDLDPSNAESELDTRRRSKGGPTDQLPPVRGDLVHGDAIKLLYNAANDAAFGPPNGKKWDLITEVPLEEGEVPNEDESARRERKRKRKEEKKAKKAERKMAKRAKKEAKAAKKSKKKKKKKSHRKGSSDSSDSDVGDAAAAAAER